MTSYKTTFYYTAKQLQTAGTRWLHIPGSSVEEYRAGRIVRLPYDLSDPLDRSICIALQLFVDHQERLTSEYGARVMQAPEDQEDKPTQERNARLLESYMCSLRDDLRGELALSSEQRYIRAHDVLRCLFGAERALDGDSMSMESGYYEVGRNFWDAGQDALNDLQPTTHQPKDEVQDSLPGLLAQDTPARFPQSMAPLIALIQQALGGLVSQSEAARRLGLTPRGVALRIARGELRKVTVEARVLIPEEDL